MTWSFVVAAAFVVLSVLLSAVAAAAGEEDGSGGNSALGWTQVRDSSGVELSDYIFVTNHGSLLHPGDASLSVVIGLMFAIFMAGVIMPVWLVGWVLGFGWMVVFSEPLNGVAHALSGQLATPIMFVTFGTGGAFFAAFFVQRGHYAKAAVQVVTMLIVAVVGPIYLSDPLGEVLSSHGLLAKGRDVGLSVSAGLNGDSSPNPTRMVVALQEDMADNFGRKPLQVWNFEHVIDDRPGCAAVWSAGVRAGSEDQIKDGLKACGDGAAYASANNPSFGQIGAGFVLLLTALILLLFAAYLSLKIIWSALDSVYWGLMTIIGFAGGGLLYGPTQTFMVRSVVHGMMSAVRMCIQTAALGLYLLFFGELFKQAKGREMSIFVIGAIVMIVAILQYRRLSASLDRGNEWVANRVSLAIQGPSGQGGVGGGSGRALGMGEAGATHTMGGAAMMALLAGATTIVSSPITEWALGGIPGAGRPQSLKKKRITDAQADISGAQRPIWADPEMGGLSGSYRQSFLKWAQFRDMAREGADPHGGVGSLSGAAAAMLRLQKSGGAFASEGAATLEAVGWDRRVVLDTLHVAGQKDAMAQQNPMADKDLAAIAAVQNMAENSLVRINRVGGRTPNVREEQHLEASVHALRAHTEFYRENRLPGGVTLRDGVNNLNGMRYRGSDMQAIVDDYMQTPNEAKMKALVKASGGNTDDMYEAFENLYLRTPGGIEFESLSRDPVSRIMKHVANEETKRLQDATLELARNSGTMHDPHRHAEVRKLSNRRINTENWAAGAHRAVSTPAPPDN